MARTRRLAGMAAVLLMTSCLAPWQAAAQSLEFPVKANYLVRFAAFVQWPPNAFESADDPMVICVAGADPFGAELDKASQGQIAHDRPIIVRRLGLNAPDNCHILYLGRGSTISAAAIREAEANAVLVVTDEANGRTSGAVHFVILGDRVRFRVDQTQLPRGMTIDSRLLSLALSVRSGA